MSCPDLPSLPQPPTIPSNVPLHPVYRRLRRHYGHLGWWPGDTPFEVCVGAILTQNTRWENVERAIRRVREAGRLTPQALFELSLSELAELIRAAGYFRVKARRLRAFLEVLVPQYRGSVKCLLDGETACVRARLLAIPGIGPETADSMLLYAGTHRIFVVDAYTRRIFARHGWCEPDADYATLQRLCTAGLGHPDPLNELDLFRDAHAQIVMVGKDFCRPRDPRCDVCPLGPLLPPGGRCG